MKKIILAFILSLCACAGYAQTPAFPTQDNYTNYYRFHSYLGVDSGFLLPQRDTLWSPSRPAIVFRPQDSSIYLFNGQKWWKIGQSSSTPTGVYLLASNFIDSLNNNRQTISRSGDSLYLTFGGSVSMAPDSTLYATRYWVSTQGFLTTEVEPKFTGSAAATISTTNINSWNNAFVNGSYNAATDTLKFTTAAGGVTPIYIPLVQPSLDTIYAKIATTYQKYQVDSIARGKLDTGNYASGANTVSVAAGSSAISVTGGTQPISTNPTFTITPNNTMPLWNAVQLQGLPILNTAPSPGQVLFFNGTSWVPYSLNLGSGTVTSVGLNAGYGTQVTSNTTNPITSVGVFTLGVDTTKIPNLRYLDSVLVLKKDISDSTSLTGYASNNGLKDSLNKINGINGWLYNPVSKTGQVDSTKYSTVVATHDSIVANIPNLSIYTKYTDTSNMLLPYTKKGSNISQFNNDSGYLTPFTQANANWNATSGAAQILNKPNEINFNIYNQNEDSSVTISDTTKTSIIKANSGSLLLPGNSPNTSFIGALFGTCSFSNQTITIYFLMGNIVLSIPLQISTGSVTLPFSILYVINFGFNTFTITGILSAGNNAVPINLTGGTSNMTTLNYNIQAVVSAGTLTINSSYLHRNVQ